MIKKIKGIALFLVSMAVAGSLITNSSTVAEDFLPYVGITLVGLSTYFMISGVMNLIIGLTGARWNAIWFVPYFIYTGILWLWYGATGYKTSAIHIPAMLTLLTAYLILDIAVEYKEIKLANDRNLDPSGGSSGGSGRDGVGGVGYISIPAQPDQERGSTAE